jgi:hypothetical protein
LLAATATIALTPACASASAPFAHQTVTAQAVTLSRADAGASAGTGAPRTDPSVFVAGIDCPPAKSRGTLCTRLAVLSSRTGKIVRWLTPQVNEIFDNPVSIRGGWVYFSRGSASGAEGIWRMPLAGGAGHLVQAGTADWSMSQDGHAIAYVTSNRYREELITRNLVTGQHNTIVIATNPGGNDNNWPPDVPDLTWSPNDSALALALAPTAAISSVLVLRPFTATSIKGATTAPAPCRLGQVGSQCTETDPAYLADGALSYAVQQTSDHAGALAVTTSLVSWRDGRRATLHVFAGRLSQQYDMTARGQAIWIGSPARPGGSWPILCWSGGPVTEITTLPAANSPATVVWLSPGPKFLHTVRALTRPEG